MTRELMVVDLFYNLEQLNDQKTLAEAGISAGAEVGTGQKGLSIDFWVLTPGICKRIELGMSRKLAKLAGVTLAIARFLSTGCKS